jgi:hypothetical protein
MHKLMKPLFWKRASTADEAISMTAPADTIVFAPARSQEALTPPAERVDVEAVADRLLDRRSRVRKGGTYWLWMLASPVVGLLGVLSLLGTNGWGVSSFIWVLFYGFLLLTVRLLHGLVDRLQQARSAVQNSHLGREWLGPLAEALAWPDRRVQGSAALLLTQALPRLAADDGNLLTEVQLNCLYQRLMPRAASADPELALAILTALPTLGTEEALPSVKRLAALQRFTRGRRRVRQAACATLALLERRAVTQRDAQATAPGVPSLTLSVATMEPMQSWEEVPAGTNTEEMAAASALVDAQLQEFEEEIRKLQVPGMRVAFLFASWGIILPYCAVQTYMQFAAHNWPGGLLFGASALLSTQLHRLTVTRKHEILTRRLAKIEDVRCVGRLAEALEWPDPTIRHIAIAALTRLLPRVKASDNALYTPRQRGNLHRMLILANAKQYDKCMVAILQALQQIGDETALPYVEQLANAQPTSNPELKVCDAARDCLPFLQERASQTQSSQTLLRASSAIATGTDMLVRPAIGVNPGDHEQLLRAGQRREL